MHRIQTLALVNLVALSTLAGSPAPARAGGFTIIEVGTRKTGMMTGIAAPDDLSAVYHNPAGLADQRGTRLHLSSGFSFVGAAVRLKAWPGGEGVYGSEDIESLTTPVDAEGYFAGSVEPTRYFGVMPMFVASSDFGFERGPVAALSLYVPDFIGAFLPDDAPTRYMVTEAYFVAAVCSASLAYRLPGALDFLSLGASLGVLYVRQEGKKWLNQQTIGEENADYVLHLAGEDYRPFFNLGVLAEVFPGVTLGFLYIMGADVDLAGRLDIELPPGVTEEDPLLAAAGGLVGHYRQDTFMRVPDGLGLGIHWAVTRWLELSFDFRYWLYSQFKEQVVRHNIRLESLPGLVPEEFVTPKNYEDSWTTSLGALVRPFDDLPLEVMGGGSYDHSPAPNNTKSLDSPTVNLAGFSLGARYTLAERWRFSLTYYRYWYLKDRTTDSILVPPQNSEFSGSVDTFSVQTEVRF